MTKQGKIIFIIYYIICFFNGGVSLDGMKKEIVIITGASRGIGYAIAKKLNDEFLVINLSRTPTSNFVSIQVDVTEPKQLFEAFQFITENYGIPSVLINNAGYVDPKELLEITYDQWMRTLNTNLTGTFLCTQQFVSYNKSGGKIINIASTAGTRSQPGWSAYAASKAGIINFSLTMSAELKPLNIKVYCVTPGRCATDLRRKLAPEEDQSKIMQPQEVADFVYYLIKEDQLLDGQSIIVKRGR